MTYCKPRTTVSIYDRELIAKDGSKGSHAVYWILHGSWKPEAIRRKLDKSGFVGREANVEYLNWYSHRMCYLNPHTKFTV